jgi:hypothetical protein
VPASRQRNSSASFAGDDPPSFPRLRFAPPSNSSTRSNCDRHAERMLVFPGNQNTSTSSNRLNAQANLRCLVREVRYNVNLETRDEDVVWIGEHGPYRHHIG